MHFLIHIALTVCCFLGLRNLSAAPANSPKIAFVSFQADGPRQSFIADTCKAELSRNLKQSGKFDVISFDDVARVAEGVRRGAGEEEIFKRLRDDLGCQYTLKVSVLRADVSRNRFSGYGVVSDKLTYVVEAKLEAVNMFDGKIVFTKPMRGQSLVTHLGGASGEDAGQFANIARTEMRTLTEPLASALRNDIKRSEGDINKFLASTSDQSSSNPKVMRGRLRFICNVDGASIEIDGVIEGNNNDTISVDEGVHELVVRARGDEELKTKVRAKSGQEQQIQLDLTPKSLK